MEQNPLVGDGLRAENARLTAENLALYERIAAGVASEFDELIAERDRLAESLTAFRLRAVAVHEAVWRARNYTPESAAEALADDGYLHAAVHALLDFGPSASLPDETRAHVDRQDRRIERLESEVARLAAQLLEDGPIAAAARAWAKVTCMNEEDRLADELFELAKPKDRPCETCGCELRFHGCDEELANRAKPNGGGA